MSKIEDGCDEEGEFELSLSCAISLKRIADALERIEKALTNPTIQMEPPYVDTTGRELGPGKVVPMDLETARDRTWP